jgi:NitT/TauT family transport system permease protein
VIAEFVSGSGRAQGLAWRLLEAGNRLRTAELLAALVWLAALGLLLNLAVAAGAREILKRRSGR